MFSTHECDLWAVAAYAVVGSIGSQVFILADIADSVLLALSGGVAVAELSTGTVMAIGMSRVVPSKSLSLGTVFGGTSTIRHHIVVLGTGALIAMPR